MQAIILLAPPSPIGTVTSLALKDLGATLRLAIGLGSKIGIITTNRGEIRVGTTVGAGRRNGAMNHVVHFL